MLVAPIGAAAQNLGDTDQPDKGWLVELLQDNLSDAGRDVQIDGFRGALSSTAEIDKLTISDVDGAWLIAQNLSLDWDRAALFNGVLDVTSLRADHIHILRAPVPDPNAPIALPTATATPFSLPDLPIAIKLDALNIQDIQLDAALLGQEMHLQLSGNANLENGAGTTAFQARRIDERADQFDISGQYSNATGQLQLAMQLTEAAGGLVSKVIGLPGEPSIDLDLDGAGTLDDFVASLRLATDGQDRVTGQLNILQDAATQDRRLNVDIGGDVTALFAPQYQAFFGPDTSLRAQTQRQADGTLKLTDLDLRARAITLSGQAEISPEGWPKHLQLTGQISDPAGVVTLPIPGDVTQVAAADISLSFDAEAGQQWSLVSDVRHLDRPDMQIQSLTLSANGVLENGDGAQIGAVTAGLSFGADGLTLADPALQQALGDRISGLMDLNWTENAPLQVPQILLLGAGVEILADASIHDGQVNTNVLASARNFDRFSGLAGMDLTGAGDVTLSGTLTPLARSFDLLITANTDDLGLGQPRLDPLLRGPSRAAMHVVRDQTGTQIDGLTLRNGMLSLNGSVDLQPDSIEAHIDAALSDLAPVIPGLSGPARLNGDVTQIQDGSAKADLSLTAPGTDLTITASMAPRADAYETKGQISGRIDNLRPYGAVIGQTLNGGASVTAQITAQPTERSAQITLEGQTTDIGMGDAQIDQVLRGIGALSAEIDITDQTNLTVTNLRATFPNLTASGAFSTDGVTGNSQFQARLRDIGLFAPGLNGAVTAQGTATLRRDGVWQIAAQSSGPGSAGMNVAGDVTASGLLDLGLTGNVPLGLINGYIEPRRIDGTARLDLRLQGPAGINAVSGDVRIDDTGLSLPTIGRALRQINGVVTLRAGQATLAITGDDTKGGAVEVSGSVGLAVPFVADLDAQIDGLVLRDPTLYDTRLDGRITAQGPLAGGASIIGDMNLGRTELQIPSSSISILGELPDITHLGAAPDVQQTLARAGLSLRPVRSAPTTARPYDLDLSINAPSRIFVRGRGLDAELGGTLRLTGTTHNMVPLGEFSLIRGRIDILQQRFDLTKGAARIEGDFSPFLTLTAVTETEDGIEVQITLEGPADSPSITFTSSPELPQDEVLAHLLFGRNLTEISALQAVQLASAISTLAGRGNGGVINQFRESVGLDDLDITADDQGNAAVRAGAYVSENVYTNVTIDSSGTTEIELNLDVTDDVTVRGRTTSDGETALGIFYERDY
ncbi:translocation/assembly module TamB domain-containing protein [Aestuariibius sp. HNIBRBA575]|uniref:translocation/assembly module TamB domain-containing protein n=1 Tax=Aestuariibius sp. HNIBRBA575 TaxID=3233343 RepID=UPI0034A2DE80